MSKFDTVYRVIENVSCNDFNNELEYTIIAYDYDIKNNKMKAKGFASWIPVKDDIIYEKRQAEQELVNKTVIHFKNQLKQAKEKLAEKEKEIDELKFFQRNTTSLIEKVSENGEKQIRHEICEEIRNELNNEEHFTFSYLTQKEINKVIDQIEGEK